MPRMTTEISGSPVPKAVRFKVKATGEYGSGVGSHNGSRNIGRLVSIGSQNNIRIIDIALDETGEVRTYLADHLEQLPGHEE